MPGGSVPGRPGRAGPGPGGGWQTPPPPSCGRGQAPRQPGGCAETPATAGREAAPATGAVVFRGCRGAGFPLPWRRHHSTPGASGEGRAPAFGHIQPFSEHENSFPDILKTS